MSNSCRLSKIVAYWSRIAGGTSCTPRKKLRRTRERLSKRSRSAATSSTASSCLRSSTRWPPTAASCKIKQITIGTLRNDPSHAVLEVRAASADELQKILAQIADHGAVPTDVSDCTLVAADMDGAFPEDFYSTTNQRTEVRVAGRWIGVADQEMDCAILVDVAKMTARCLAMTDIRLGDKIVVGHAGVRVFPEERARGAETFEFMGSNVSTEKPKGVAIRQIAAAACREPRVGRHDGGRGRPGRRPHRQRRVSGTDDSHGLRRRALRRQRPGHARHRAGPVRHEPGRLSRPRHPGRGRARASPAGDQPHPPPGRHPARGGKGRAQRRDHV